MLLSLAVLGGFALYVMNAQERERLRQAVRRVHLAVLCVAARVLDAGAFFVRAVRARNRGARVTMAALVVVAAATVFGGAFNRPPRDIGADIEQLAATESRISAVYDAAAAQFRLGAMTTASLAEVIERRIEPELQIARIRLLSLEQVKPEQIASLEKAREYLRLRGESWRQRAAALQRRDLKALRQVEATERASLAALAAAVQDAGPSKIAD